MEPTRTASSPRYWKVSKENSFGVNDDKTHNVESNDSVFHNIGLPMIKVRII